ncbi:hypothetical protein AC45_5238 [Escherichia coli 2-210-07_S3_C3]|nr:hypothetical protein AC45_5238 [Escherichia coli 2-210-07_S3_C3]
MIWLFSHVVESSTLFKEPASLFRLASSVLLMVIIMNYWFDIIKNHKYEILLFIRFLEIWF